MRAPVLVPIRFFLPILVGIESIIAIWTEATAVEAVLVFVVDAVEDVLGSDSMSVSRCEVPSPAVKIPKLRSSPRPPSPLEVHQVKGKALIWNPSSKGRLNADASTATMPAITLTVVAVGVGGNAVDTVDSAKSDRGVTWPVGSTCISMPFARSAITQPDSMPAVRKKGPSQSCPSRPTKTPFQVGLLRSFSDQAPSPTCMVSPANASSIDRRGRCRFHLWCPRHAPDYPLVAVVAVAVFQTPSVSVFVSALAVSTGQGVQCPQLLGCRLWWSVAGVPSRRLEGQT